MNDNAGDQSLPSFSLNFRADQNQRYYCPRITQTSYIPASPNLEPERLLTYLYMYSDMHAYTTTAFYDRWRLRGWAKRGRM